MPAKLNAGSPASCYFPPEQHGARKSRVLAVNTALFHELFVGWVVALRTSNMLVYLRDGSAQTVVRAATPREELQIKLFISPSHNILTPGRPVPVLTQYRQAPACQF